MEWNYWQILIALLSSIVLSLHLANIFLYLFQNQYSPAEGLLSKYSLIDLLQKLEIHSLIPHSSVKVQKSPIPIQRLSTDDFVIDSNFVRSHKIIDMCTITRILVFETPNRLFVYNSAQIIAFLLWYGFWIFGGIGIWQNQYTYIWVAISLGWISWCLTFWQYNLRQDLGKSIAIMLCELEIIHTDDIVHVVTLQNTWKSKILSIYFWPII